MASSRGRQAIRHERQPLPFWVGLVAGFVLGILASTLLIYRDYNLERKRDAENTRPTPAAAAPAPVVPSLPPHLLEPVAPSSAPLPSVTPAPPAPTADTRPAAPTPAAPPPATTTAPSGRLLVAGSLKSRAEAEQRKAELALMGLSSRVIETTVGGERRFRVTMGPFGNDAELDQVRQQLKANGIDSFTPPLR